MSKLKGFKLTEDHKRKIGEKNKISLLGNIPWNKGKHLSEKHKIALSKSHNGKVAWNKGLPLSEEQNKKLHESHKGKPSWNKGRPYVEIQGKNHWNWKGGITSLYHAIRTSFEYKLWRADVFERDKFTCQECNAVGVYLNADHIKPFSVIMMENNIKTFEQALKCEELWDISNGRALCVSCHRKTDTYGYKAIQLLAI